MTLDIRRAIRAELPTLMTVFHSSMLAISTEDVRLAIEDERVLVAAEDDRVLGAVVLGTGEADDVSIDAIVVRRGRRGQGIGSTLVWAAAARYGALVAEFDAGVRPFWESLGFDVEPASEPARYVGRLDPDATSL